MESNEHFNSNFFIRSSAAGGRNGRARGRAALERMKKLGEESGLGFHPFERPPISGITTASDVRTTYYMFGRLTPNVESLQPSMFGRLTTVWTT